VEANGGAIAGALGLPVDRPFDLKAKADGVISKGAFSVVAKTGDETPLDATGSWAPEGGAARGRIELGASTLTRVWPTCSGRKRPSRSAAARPARSMT
jgi:translocation and assembly module TamB